MMMVTRTSIFINSFIAKVCQSDYVMQNTSANKFQVIRRPLVVIEKRSGLFCSQQETQENAVVAKAHKYEDSTACSTRL